MNVGCFVLLTGSGGTSW